MRALILMAFLTSCGGGVSSGPSPTPPETPAIANAITVTPTQVGGCQPAICSGGDALVSARLTQGQSPLPGRGVRFDAVSGDFRFITSSQPETLDISILVVTDETGTAQARIRVLPSAPNQTALLQVTDLGSNSFQSAGFLIAQATGGSPGFFVTPDKVTFSGAFSDQCNSGSVSATFFVFGGVAPYSVFNSNSAFILSQNFVDSSGGSFTLTPNGQCVDSAPITVRDASGRTTTALVSNVRGTQQKNPLLVSPNAATLSDCTMIATVTVTGGNGNYVASSTTDAILVTPVGSTHFSIRRKPKSPATVSPQTIGISDGQTVVNVAVTLTGAGAGICP